jgi:hypothetical protein
MTEQSLSIIEGQMSKAQAAVSMITVNCQVDYDKALDVGRKVNQLLKSVDEQEKEITRPINESLKLIRSKYKPFKEELEGMKKTISDKMTAYVRMEEAKKALAEEKLLKRAEKGTMKEETVVGKLAKLEDEKVQTNGGMTSVLMMEVEDVKLIPAEYLIVDETKAKAAYREGKEVAGIKFFYEKRSRF